jgi:hypothetical protein
LGSALGATTCTGWKQEPSDRCTKEMPAFESRRVRTQPRTVISLFTGIDPDNACLTLATDMP